MDVRDATRMILAESAGHPELLRTARFSYDELSNGRPVPYSVLSGMLREAARKNVFPALKQKHGDAAFDAMVIAIGREIDRQAPVLHH